jgi:hypothetical protein
MRKSPLFSAVLTLFLLVPASITWAQTISSQKGLTAAIFTTPHGNVKIYLPDDIRPGDVVSGSIRAEPAGKNAKQLEKNLSELIRYSVNIDSFKFIVPAKPETFKWLVHGDRQLTSPIELLDVKGYKAGELKIQFTQEPIIIPPPKECFIPSHILTGSPFTIKGVFDGDAGTTKCLLNNQPLEILAESPRQCNAQYPDNAGGLQQLYVTENSRDLFRHCGQSVSGVQMNVSSGKLNLQKGEKTYIAINISGLQYLPDTALLTLVNSTAGIVTMTPSNNILIPLPPDSTGTGIFNKRFDIQSLRSGSFIVNVNLDLPETQTSVFGGVNFKTCECVAGITVSKKETKGNIISFDAAIKAECKGVYGQGVNTFVQCAVAKKEIKWSISSGKENAEITGGVSGESVTVKRKGNGQYTLSAELTVTCSDGTTCNDKDEVNQDGKTTGRTTTTTTDGKCECDPGCAIKKVETKAGEVSFKGDIKAMCKGYYGSGTKKECKAGPVDMKWYIGKGGEDVAEIAGNPDGETAKVKIKKAGSYVLYLKITYTCSDGAKCEFVCNTEQTVPPVTTTQYCERKIEELTVPKIAGGLKIDDKLFLAKRTILRDDFIALGAEGVDYDMLKIICDPVEPDCRDTESEKLILLSGRVRFEWKIMKGDGRFVKLGCLYTKDANDRQDTGDHVIFMPPALPLAVIGKDTAVTTYIRLFIIDDKMDAMNDGQIEKDFEIITRRNSNNPDVYKIEIVYKYEKLPQPTKPDDPKKGTCEVKREGWDGKKDLQPSKIIFPNVPDSNKMVLGQWIVLMAENLKDNDVLKNIVCNSGSNCATEPPVDKVYEDNIQWEWADDGLGRFVSGRIGRYVIYEMPSKMPEGKKELDVVVKAKVYNPDGLMATDDAKWSAEAKIKVYQPGIQMQYPPVDWTPAENNSVQVVSELKYKKGDKWEPAFAHMCRIHFVELLNVSEEKGVCLNDPEKEKANQCRDLQLKTETEQEAYDAGKMVKEKCTLTDQWQKARTVKPERSYSINVYSLDFGSYGFIRSLAKLSKSTVEAAPGILYEYISIPWTDETVKHLHAVRRDKAKMYSDNRVTIPYDIDENQIPDAGWMTFNNITVPDPLHKNADEDETPRGDGFNGDGLTNYEEYRGFKTLQLKVEVTGGTAVQVWEPEHARTNHMTKNIFIHNRNRLDISLYKTATGLEVFEISEPQYQSNKIRVVNFNFNPNTHVADQKGLYLYDGGSRPGLLGKAWSSTGTPTIPNFEDSIVIYTNNIAVHVNKVNKEIDEANERREREKKGSGTLKNLLLADKQKTVIAHELCHGNNVCHHGEGDESVEYDNQTRNPLRSGNISCIMRYDNHRKEGSGWYIGYAPETPGTILCTSQAGTGYNADGAGHKDAAPGRGNCVSQLRVSGRGPRPLPCGKPK